MKREKQMNRYTVKAIDLRTDKRFSFEVQAETYVKAQDFVRNEYLQLMKARQEWILINAIENHSHP
jgi:hypothetical protein